MLIGMDVIRGEETIHSIHAKASEYQASGDYESAEKTYRDALRLYPNKPGIILGLAGVLALKGDTEESIELIERGLPLSDSEKQKATMRAASCFLYLKAGRKEKANQLATTLPHMRESREVILPLIQKGLDEKQMDVQIKRVLLGE